MSISTTAQIQSVSKEESDKEINYPNKNLEAEEESENEPTNEYVLVRFLTVQNLVLFSIVFTLTNTFDWFQFSCRTLRLYPSWLLL